MTGPLHPISNYSGKRIGGTPGLIPVVGKPLDGIRIHQCPITGAYLLHDAKGLKVQKNRFDSAWQRVMEKAVNDGLEVDGQQIKLEEPFTFHDLKAKGVTDHTEQWAGHKSEKARNVYIRKLREIDATR